MQRSQQHIKLLVGWLCLLDPGIQSWAQLRSDTPPASKLVGVEVHAVSSSSKTLPGD
jgi:hypothetical protein